MSPIIKAILPAFAFAALSCTSRLDLPESRRECYRENRCESAHADCYANSDWICRLNETPLDPENISLESMRSETPDGLLCSSTYIVLACSTARESCYEDCNKSSHY